MVFDPERRFVFTNWTDEEFKGYWDKREYVFKAGDVRELPMYLAYHFCKHLIDRELHKQNRDMAVADPEARRPLEEKTIREIMANEESPERVALREEIRKEVMAQIGEAVSEKVDTKVAEAEGKPKAKKGGKKAKKDDEQVAEAAPSSEEFAGVEK